MAMRQAPKVPEAPKAEPKSLYRLLGPNVLIDGKLHDKGEVVEAEDRLYQLFPDKMRPMAEEPKEEEVPEPEPVPDAEPKAEPKDGSK